MKTTVTLIFLTLCAGTAAQAATLFSAPDGFVNDFASVLQPSTAAELERILGAVEKKSRMEFHIVTLPALPKKQTVRETAIALFREWKIGKQGENNGLLLLLAPNDRGLHLEAGALFQPILAQPAAGQAMSDAMSEAVGRGAFDQALLQGARVILELLDRGLHLGLNPHKLFAPAK